MAPLLSPMHSLARSVQQSLNTSSGSKYQTTKRVAERVFALILAITLGVVGYNLVFITQYTLATGRFKFPFPLTATFVQLAVTHALLSCLGLLYIVQPFFKTPRYSSISKEHYAHEEENDSTWKSEASDSGTLLNLTFSLYILPKFRDYALLSFILAGKTLLMNCSLTYSDSHNYEQGQLISFALLLAYETLSGKQQSLPYLSLSSIAVLNIFLANTNPNIRFPWESFLSVALSSLFGAAFLYVLHSRSNARQQPQSYSLGDAKPSTRQGSVQEQLIACWEALYYTTLFSLLAITLVILLSGEAWSVLHDYYFYTDRSFLLLMLAGGALTCLLYITTVLLVQLSNPLFTAFMAAVQIAIQLLWFHQASELAHVRVVVGTLSCLGFWFITVG